MTPLFYEMPFLLLLLLASGFFSGSETALFSLTRVQLEQLARRHPAASRRITDLLERPRRLIITLLLGNEFVNVAISSLSAVIIIEIFHQDMPWINVAVVLPILLLFGEITPKTLAIRGNARFAVWVARPLTWFSYWITPLRWLIRNISDRIVNLFVTESLRRGSILNEDVIKTIVEESEREGILDAFEKEFIYNVFDFGDKKLDEVMTPRANLFYLSAELPLQRMVELIKENHFSKVPVYQGNRDRIIGILFATDLIGLSPAEIADSANTLQRIKREPYFVPVTKRADELFRTFQHRKISVAIVLDEYGGVLGLVTMEDLLEVIFGEIADEYEHVNQQHEQISERAFKVNAAMTLDEFNDLLGVNLQSDEVDTIGGFVFALFGELPGPRATMAFESLHFTIERVTNNRIETLIVRKRS